MALIRVLACAAVFSASLGFAQTPIEALAERVVASGESEGREFAPALRKQMLEALGNESMEQLMERLRTGRIAPAALGDARADLVFTSVTPCRIIDTRQAGGKLSPGIPRSFRVAGSSGFIAQGGNSTGCGVPTGATSVSINFVAVAPDGAGNLRALPYPDGFPPQGASIINYQLLSPSLNIANGLIVPICDPTAAPPCDFDINVMANGAAVHLVADITGYFNRFPKITGNDIDANVGFAMFSATIDGVQIGPGPYFGTISGMQSASTDSSARLSIMPNRQCVASHFAAAGGTFGSGTVQFSLVINGTVHPVCSLPAGFQACVQNGSITIPPLSHVTVQIDRASGDISPPSLVRFAFECR